MIAALFVDPRGCYANIPDVDLWDQKRDARTYQGPHPVVAHPPCGRWCQLAHIVEKRYGYKVGDDDGCFASALHSVRTYGGVLEHPAYSIAWDHHALPVPPRRGWLKTFCNGWVCHVEQHRYGHMARKATWLYANVKKPPKMLWGTSDSSPSQWRHYRTSALVSWCNNHNTQHDTRPRIGKKQAQATPPAFRDALLHIAQSAC